MFQVFYPTASATAYGQRPKFFEAKHSATAEGENWAYGPTLLLRCLEILLLSMPHAQNIIFLAFDEKQLPQKFGFRGRSN